MEQPVVIIGGGITGLTIGFQLAKEGEKVIIIEKEARVGGLARSFTYSDFTFDIGPHRFHAENTGVLDFISGILRNSATQITRRSGVFFRDAYYAWPLRPGALFNLEASTAFTAVADLLSMKMRKRGGKTETFEEYIVQRYGPTLYNAFFRDYTHKFFGLHPRDIHADWAREGMKKAVISADTDSWSLSTIAASVLRPPGSRTKFIYPGRGIGQFSDLLADAIVRLGGEIITGRTIDDIVFSGDSVRGVRVDGTNVVPRQVVWTAPVDELCAIAGIPCDLSYLSLLVYNIEAASLPEGRYQWCYFGDRDIVFNRVSLPALFSAKAAPPGASGICVEVTCLEGDDRWLAPGTLLPRIAQDLKRTRLIPDVACIRNIHTEKIRKAYPRYCLDYSRSLASVKGALSRYANLVLAGRSGLFWYNNMDDSIANALTTAHGLLAPAVTSKSEAVADRYAV